jgi:hypothetical protein
MTTYVMLMKWTDQGVVNIKSSPKRADTARFLAKSCGAEIKELYLTMGEYDLIATVIPKRSTSRSSKHYRSRAAILPSAPAFRMPQEHRPRQHFPNAAGEAFFWLSPCGE